MSFREDTEYQPLTLVRFGIELRRMVEADKEDIRIGRNQDFVRNNHLYRDIISVEEHEAWFQQMNSSSHYILLIHYHGRKVGVVIVKDIPANKATSTCGAFLWDNKFLGSKVPILSILTALDFFYYTVGVYETNSVVLKSNTAAIKMNKFFGFFFQEKNSESFTINMNRETYLSNRERLIAFACRVSKNRKEQVLKIGGSKSTLNLPEINSLLTE